jgi:hypothetical protein
MQLSVFVLWIINSCVNSKPSSVRIFNVRPVNVNTWGVGAWDTGWKIRGNNSRKRGSALHLYIEKKITNDMPSTGRKYLPFSLSGGVI